MPNENIMGVPTRACINGFTKEDTERLKNALIKKIVNDDTVIDITDDGKIIVADGDGLYLSFDGNILGLIKDDSGDYIPQTVPYLPEDDNENPLVPPSGTIMTSDNIAVDPRIVHTTGNERISGLKQGDFRGIKLNSPNPTNTGKWLKYAILNDSLLVWIMEVTNHHANNGSCYGKFFIGGGGEYSRDYSIINSRPPWTAVKIVIFKNTTTRNNEIWIYVNNVAEIKDLNFYILESTNGLPIVTYPNTEHDTLPESGYGTPVYVIGSA